MLCHAPLCLPVSRKTAEKSRGQRRRKPSSEPVAQNDEDTLMLLMAMPGPGTDTHTDTHTDILTGSLQSFFSLPNLCHKILNNKHFLSPTDFIATCVKSQFLPAICMLLLCRQQPPNISNNNSAVVDFKDMATPTAGKSMGRQSKRQNSNVLIIMFSVYLDQISNAK